MCHHTHNRAINDQIRDKFTINFGFTPAKNQFKSEKDAVRFDFGDLGAKKC